MPIPYPARAYPARVEYNFGDISSSLSSSASTSAYQKGLVIFATHHVQPLSGLVPAFLLTTGFTSGY
jgi:hypothetical protein